MVEFLLIIDKIINYTKKDIDNGNTPSKIYKICSCIRESFCLSYAIRKNNRLWIYFHRENYLIELNGEKLRFLGSDERSQALLLIKAINMKNIIVLDKWKQSTPGIFVRKFENETQYFSYLCNNINKETTIIPFKKSLDPFFFEEKKNKIEIKLNNIIDPEKFEDKLYILSFNKKSDDILISFISYLYNFNNELLDNIIILKVDKIVGIADNILYINYLIDTQKKK